MRKTLLLATLLTTVLFTGCGTKEAKADEVNAEVVNTVVYDETVEESDEVIDVIYTVEEAKSEVYGFMSDVYAEYEDYGWSEALRDDVIELCESIVYDESFEYGFDVEQWQLDMVEILIRHEVLPEVCSGFTLEELSEISVAYNDLM